MTAVDRRSVEAVIARAVLSVPGVTGLQPGLGRSLADAAHPRRPPGTPSPAPGGGVRVRYARDGRLVHVEVRCVVTADHRALDTARAVRARVRAAVHAHASRRGTADGDRAAAEDVVVAVTITRVTGHGPSAP